MKAYILTFKEPGQKRVTQLFDTLVDAIAEGVATFEHWFGELANTFDHQTTVSAAAEEIYTGMDVTCEWNEQDNWWFWNRLVETMKTEEIFAQQWQGHEINLYKQEFEDHEYQNPYSADAKRRRVKYLKVEYQHTIRDFPNFDKSGNVWGMKNLYYGKGALLVRCGNYIYNVTSEPNIYFNLAK